jgi:hypothetical protein
MLHIPQNRDSVYTFWVRFPLSTQMHILSLCSECLSVRLLAVFRDTKWRNPASRLFVAFHWTHSAYTSREQHPNRQWTVLRSKARAAPLRLARGLRSGAARRTCYVQHTCSFNHCLGSRIQVAWRGSHGFLQVAACHLVEAGLKRGWPALTRRRGQPYSPGDPRW